LNAHENIHHYKIPNQIHTHILITTMKAAIIAAALASAASAQVTYDPNTGKFTCAVPNGVYCAGDSLSTNIIIRCSNGVGQPGNCNDNLAGIPPVGVKSSALCYQSSLTAADGACSYNGVAYPDGKPSFTIGSGNTYPSSTPSPSASTYVGPHTVETIVTLTSTAPCTTSTLSSVYIPPPVYSTGVPPPPPVYSTGVAPPPPVYSSGSGSTGTGTGSPQPPPTGTWSATATPKPTVFPGAGNMLSANWALLPAAGLVAALL
jgi:hypothetical protein